MPESCVCFVFVFSLGLVVLVVVERRAVGGLAWWARDTGCRTRRREDWCGRCGYATACSAVGAAERFPKGLVERLLDREGC